MRPDKFTQKVQRERVGRFVQKPTSRFLVLIALVCITTPIRAVEAQDRNSIAKNAESTKRGDNAQLRGELQAARLAEITAGAEPEKIEQLYAGIVARHPQSAEAHTAYGEYLWTLDRNAAALAQWLAAEKLDPEHAATLFHLGEAHYAMGDMTLAGKYFTRAVARDPKNAAYHFHLGNVLFTFRDANRLPGDADTEPVKKRGLEHLRLASDLQPFNRDFARGYAETFWGMREPDWNAALAAWQRYLPLAENKDFARSQIVRVHIKLGDRAEAARLLDAIQSPEFQQLKTRLRARLEEE